MNRSHLIAGAVIALAGAFYYWVGSSRLLGSPDSLMGTKTALYIISAVGVVWFVSWLNRQR